MHFAALFVSRTSDSSQKEKIPNTIACPKAFWYLQSEWRHHANAQLEASLGYNGILLSSVFFVGLYLCTCEKYTHSFFIKLTLGFDTNLALCCLLTVPALCVTCVTYAPKVVSHWDQPFQPKSVLVDVVEVYAFQPLKHGCIPGDSGHQTPTVLYKLTFVDITQRIRAHDCDSGRYPSSSTTSTGFRVGWKVYQLNQTTMVDYK